MSIWLAVLFRLPKNSPLVAGDFIYYNSYRLGPLRSRTLLGTHSSSFWRRWSCRIWRTSLHRSRVCAPTPCPVGVAQVDEDTVSLRQCSRVGCGQTCYSQLRDTHPVMDEGLPGMFQFLNESVHKTIELLSWACWLAVVFWHPELDSRSHSTMSRCI